MSALGQKRSFRPGQPNVRYAPIADIRDSGKRLHHTVCMLIAGIPTAGTMGDRLAARSAVHQPGGANAVTEPTSQLDPSVGAGHSRIGMTLSQREDNFGSTRVAAHTRFVFSRQMRLTLPGLFRVSGCDAAGLCNQARHTEPL